jgi:hypothetical protein
LTQRKGTVETAKKRKRNSNNNRADNSVKKKNKIIERKNLGEMSFC